MVRLKKERKNKMKGKRVDTDDFCRREKEGMPIPRDSTDTLQSRKFIKFLPACHEFAAKESGNQFEIFRAAWDSRQKKIMKLHIVSMCNLIVAARCRTFFFNVFRTQRKKATISLSFPSPLSLFFFWIQFFFLKVLNTMDLFSKREQLLICREFSLADRSIRSNVFISFTYAVCTTVHHIVYFPKNRRDRVISRNFESPKCHFRSANRPGNYNCKNALVKRNFDCQAVCQFVSKGFNMIYIVRVWKKRMSFWTLKILIINKFQNFPNLYANRKTYILLFY